MGGKCRGIPEVISRAPETLDVFVIGKFCLYSTDPTAEPLNRLLGTNSAVYHKWFQTATGWKPGLTDYESLGGTVIRDISAVSWGQARIDYFVIGTDGGIYQKYWTPPDGYQGLEGVSYSAVAKVS